MRPPPPEKPRASIVPLLLAGVLAMMVFAALFFLTLGWIGPVLVIGVGIFGLGALQYVVWGWWVARILAADRDEEDERSSDEPVRRRDDQ